MSVSQAPATVFFDCDPGNGLPGADIDDGLALALAKRSPGIALAGVGIVAGNVDQPSGVKVALSLMAADGDDTTPVYAGAAVPLVQDPRPWREAFDGRGQRAPATDLWGDAAPLPAATREVSRVHAARALADLVMAHSGQVNVVATGPLTNLALALRIEPALARNVARLYLMGGAFSGPGGMRELNFAYDPEAAHIVLTSGAPTTLVPLDVTRQTLLTLEDNRRFLGSSDPLTRLLGQTGDPWIRFLAAIRGTPGCHLHDPLAMAVVVEPSLITTETMHLTVELHGEHTRGRPVRWLADGSEVGDTPPLGAGPIDVAQSVDAPRFLEFLMETLL